MLDCNVSTITFLGAAGTVTGSAYLLTPDSGKSVLIDFGMFQGNLDLEALNHEELRFNPQDVTAVVVTHAHLDHVGRLPILAKNGLKVPIYMTAATKALTELSLLDSAKVGSESDHPLYSTEDVRSQVPYMHIVDYHKPFQVGPYIFTMVDAGHILGSTSLIVTEKKAGGKTNTIVFSGDLGNSPQDLIRPTEYIESANTVIMESTYGNRIHPVEDPTLLLKTEINEVENNQGTLLIPAFSLERTQEILHKIDHLKKERTISEETRVYLDSPMAQRATAIFRSFKTLYNSELASHVTRDDPFDFPGLVLVESAKESQRIQDDPTAKVIIAGSGMMTGGRITHHAKTFLGDARNRLLFVGYQAEGTLGRAISEGETRVLVERAPVTIKAHVSQTHSMSSHADQVGLLKWIDNIKGKQTVILTHGEDEPRKTLGALIQKADINTKIVTPLLGDQAKV